MLAFALTYYRKSNQRVLKVTIVAAALFAIQSLLGAVVVWQELPPTFVAIHLGTATLLFACGPVWVWLVWLRVGVSRSTP